MNIKAVAKRANVSTATVSRTINGSAKVSPRTAERVRLAVEALNFYPNANARALGSGRSSLYVLIANTNYDAERMKLCVTRMLERKVDGVAIMTSEMDDSLIEAFGRRNIPLVFLDTGTPAPGVSCVQIDYQSGVDDAMEHLTSLGHRSIAFISGPLSLASARTRFQAFQKSSAQQHLTKSPALIQEGNHRVDGGHAAMQRILESGARPTAVFASNDLTAIGAMGAINEFGLRVPRDISVIGFDDIQLSAYTMPPLTTVSLPRAAIANAAFRALLNAQIPGGKK